MDATTAITKRHAREKRYRDRTREQRVMLRGTEREMAAWKRAYNADDEAETFSQWLRKALNRAVRNGF